jgi:CDP-diacylglycerol--glycerol-3-phosphate 3-phosphatidyltransferase
MADPLGRAIRAAAKYPAAMLAKAKISANQLTVIGLAVNCTVAYFIATGRLSYIATGLLIWAAGFFDALDGSVARYLGKVTVFGNFLDSVVDRYSDSVIYFGIMISAMRTNDMGYAAVTVAAMIGSMCVSYVRAKAESLDSACEIGLMPRTVRIVLLGAGFCIAQPFWTLSVIAALSHLTVVQRVIYVRKDILAGKR